MAEPFIAEIKLFAGNFAPRGYAFCNGQILSIAQNTALFSLIGTIYGGNGTTNFALPDLRGRTPIHWGQGTGLSNYDIGQVGGTEATTLLINQLPPHTHAATVGTLAIRAKNAPGNSQTPVGNVPANEAAGVTATYSNAAPDASMNAAALSGAPALANTGGGLPVSIVQPYLAVTYIIALEGIFPSRN
jgi:microcystin-dependent protein